MRSEHCLPLHRYYAVIELVWLYAYLSVLCMTAELTLQQGNARLVNDALQAAQQASTERAEQRKCAHSGWRGHRALLGEVRHQAAVLAVELAGENVSLN